MAAATPIAREWLPRGDEPPGQGAPARRPHRRHGARVPPGEGRSRRAVVEAAAQPGPRCGAVVVAHGRRRFVATRTKAPHQVHVLADPQGLVEAAHRLRGVTADHQGGGGHVRDAGAGPTGPEVTPRSRGERPARTRRPRPGHPQHRSSPRCGARRTPAPGRRSGGAAARASIGRARSRRRRTRPGRCRPRPARSCELPRARRSPTDG